MAGDDLIFGSEIPSLLHHPRLARRLDRRALARYLAYEYVPSPHTIYEGIHKLPPASWLTFDLDSRKRQIGRYYHLRFPAASPALDEREAGEALLDRLREAVRDRLMSEVPLGVLLSGGIDSSAIVALMAELVPPARIETFTIAFREPAFDEADFLIENRIPALPQIKRRAQFIEFTGPLFRPITDVVLDDGA